MPSSFAPGKFSLATPSLTEQQHAQRLRRAQEYIASGDVYQLVLASRFQGRHALAPFEAYHPWYGDGDEFATINNYTVNNYYVNNVSNTNISHTYRNVQFGGVTSVSHQRFTEGRFDRPVSVRASELRNVQIARGAVPIVPTLNNLRFNERQGQTPIPVRSAVMNRTFAGAPVVVQRISFDQQRAALATAAHLPVPRPIVRNERTVAPAPNVGRSAAWDRFGSGVDSRYRPLPNDAKRAQTDSWSRFNANRNGTAVERTPQNAARTEYMHPVQAQRSEYARPVQAQRPEYARPVQAQRPEYTRAAPPQRSQERRSQPEPTAHPH